MNVTDNDTTGMNTERVANDLTQLSSREQLSALMDGALPADQTRFLLRRLQHDAALAECWQRWRLSGEVMRGLAPAQRLPADFALRVGAALRGELPAQAVPAARRAPAWLRWSGGGAALAASLALAVVLVRPQPQAGPSPAPVAPLATAAAPAVPAMQERPAQAVQVAAAGEAVAKPGEPAEPVVVAAVSRPQRDRAAGKPRPVQAVESRLAEPAAQVALASEELPVPTPDIVTRPWPRSVLPQYANGGFSVGFGEQQGRPAATYNPFASLPPLPRPGVDGQPAGESGAGQQAPGEAPAQP